MTWCVGQAALTWGLNREVQLHLSNLQETALRSANVAMISSFAVRCAGALAQQFVWEYGLDESLCMTSFTRFSATPRLPLSAKQCGN